MCGEVMFGDPDTIKPQLFRVADLLDRFAVHLDVGRAGGPRDRRNQANLHRCSFAPRLCIAQKAREGKWAPSFASTQETHTGLPYLLRRVDVTPVASTPRVECATLHGAGGTLGAPDSLSLPADRPRRSEAGMRNGADRERGV